MINTLNVATGGYLLSPRSRTTLTIATDGYISPFKTNRLIITNSFLDGDHSGEGLMEASAAAARRRRINIDDDEIFAVIKTFLKCQN